MPGVVVVMAVHQGTTYLPEQVASIVEQTRRPALVVVQDDMSTDGSADLCRGLLTRAGLDHVVVRNEQRLGALRTFEAGMQLCLDADVVLLCDQDDRWRRDKVERVLAALDVEDADLAFSDGRVIDATSRLLPGSLWDHAGFSHEMRDQWLSGDALGVLLRRNVVTGAATAVRGRLLRSALPLPSEGWHDAWLALWAVTTGHAVAIPEQLVDYRLHASNAVGLTRPRTRQQVVRSAATTTPERARLLQRELDLYEVLASRIDARATPAQRASVLAKRDHLRQRLSLPRGGARRLRTVHDMWADGDYTRFSSGRASVVNDLVRPLRS